MRDLLPSIAIVLLAIGLSVAYGIAHDLVTAHVCVEYFTIGHPDVFGTDSPLLLALGWGVIATWWVGLLLGIPLAFAARAGQRGRQNRPPRPVGSLMRPLVTLLVIMYLAAAIAGGIGYLLARNGAVFLLPPLAHMVPADRHAAFLADLWAHSTSYALGFLGGVVICIRVWRSRRLAGADAGAAPDGAE